MTVTTTLDVPEAVAAYLAAERMKDVTLFDDCFAADAVVRDEGHDHRGLDAIKRWKSEADAKYNCVMTPLSARTNGDVVTVRGRVMKPRDESRAACTIQDQRLPDWRLMA